MGSEMCIRDSTWSATTDLPLRRRPQIGSLPRTHGRSRPCAIRRPIAALRNSMATMQQVEQALSVLWTTQNAAERAQANDWLTAFQESAAAWEACASLLSAGSTDDTRLFGCTVLCNKLRRGCELPPAEQGALRRHLAAQLAAVAPGRLRAQLCLSLIHI